MGCKEHKCELTLFGGKFDTKEQCEVECKKEKFEGNSTYICNNNYQCVEIPEITQTLNRAIEIANHGTIPISTIKANIEPYMHFLLLFSISENFTPKSIFWGWKKMF